MKGVILAGGSGSRLYPLTKVTNKHLLPVGRKPMLHHTIDKFIESGIKDILIVTGVNHMGAVVQSLGSGHEFGCSFTYKVQDQAGGIAEALGLARDFCGDSKFVVVLGDNIFEASLVQHVNSFKDQIQGARLLLTEVDDPERFGVATLKDGKILKIVEKPDEPESNMIVTGVYMYDSSVFDFVDRCEPSARGELEITDVNNYYVSEQLCYYDVLNGWWTDAGTFESLERANQYLRG